MKTNRTKLKTIDYVRNKLRREIPLKGNILKRHEEFKVLKQRQMVETKETWQLELMWRKLLSREERATKCQKS